MLALCTGVNLIPQEYHWCIAKTQQQYNHLSLKDILPLTVCTWHCTFTFFHIYALCVCFAGENALQIKCGKQFFVL